MATERTVLFDRCPMCGRGPVTLAQHGGLLRGASRSAPCPDCGAAFLLKGPERLELVRCEPDRLALARELSSTTACRHCRPCLQGAVLPREQWERLVEMEWPISEPSAVGCQPSAVGAQQPAHPLELEPGEELRLEVAPVSMGDEMLGLRRPTGKVIVTNRRLLYLEGEYVSSIPLDSITGVEFSQPGLTIRQEGSFEPIYLFAPPLSDALLRIREALATMT